MLYSIAVLMARQIILLLILLFAFLVMFCEISDRFLVLLHL